jgi:hypothetical protein
MISSRVVARGLSNRGANLALRALRLLFAGVMAGAIGLTGGRRPSCKLR